MPLDSARQFLQKLQADSDFRFNLVEVTRAQGHIGRSKFIKDSGGTIDLVLRSTEDQQVVRTDAMTMDSLVERFRYRVPQPITAPPTGMR